MKTMMPLLFTMMLYQSAAGGASPVKWNPAVPPGFAAQFEWVEEDQDRILKIENPNNAPALVLLATIEAPEVQSEFYAVDGQVKYEIEGQPGVLEMWNHFPAKTNGQPNASFSRTFANSGLLAHLKGKSDWRDFRLPFSAQGADSKPTKLVLNLHLPGKGVVYLKPATLNDYANLGDLVTAAGTWWPIPWSGWIGGCGGAFFGCFGALIGFLSNKGRAREFVLASSYAMIGIGVVSLVAGVIALALRQPYHVYYPLLLLGFILTVVMLGTRKQMHANYQAAEERRMAAMDAVGSSTAR